MKILLTEQYSELITEMAAIKKVAQEIDDFFEMLKAHKNTFAYVYTANTMDGKLKKKFVNADGLTVENPMLGKLFKVTTYKFNFGRTYREAVNRKNPQWQVQNRREWNAKLQGFRMTEFNEKGDLFFTIADFTSKTRYFMLDDNSIPFEVTMNDIDGYLKPSSKTTKVSGSGVNFRKLNVNKIYRFNAGGKTWNNKIFLYPILDPILRK